MEKHRVPSVPESMYYIPEFITEAEEEFTLQKVVLHMHDVLK